VPLSWQMKALVWIALIMWGFWVIPLIYGEKTLMVLFLLPVFCVGFIDVAMSADEDG